VKAGGEGALHIVQDALDQCQMRLTWVMHKQADLLNSKGQVGPRQGEVLEGAGGASVLRGVGRVSSRQLGLCIGRRGSRVAL
jgi:hypothetical protein